MANYTITPDGKGVPMESKKIPQAPGSSRQKKAAVINDMSGFGRCALTAALPIISKLKVQCCPVPTAILSNHTAYPNYYFDDYTNHMQSYIDEWKKLGLTFDGIGTGFLGSKEQIAIVNRFIRDFSAEHTIVMVDPIMGDNGKTYVTYTPAMCSEMKQLITCAHIITPNITESCILTDTAYHTGSWKEAELLSMARALADAGPSKVVITGIPQGSYIGNFCYDKNDDIYAMRRTKQIGQPRCGTGDIFSSIILADAINDIPLHLSVKKATVFIKECILASIRMEVPLTDGVCFEEILDQLKP